MKNIITIIKKLCWIMAPLLIAYYPLVSSSHSDVKIEHQGFDNLDKLANNSALFVPTPQKELLFNSYQYIDTNMSFLESYAEPIGHWAGYFNVNSKVGDYSYHSADKRNS